jgi:phytoene dehydrogenase-like protein
MSGVRTGDSNWDAVVIGGGAAGLAAAAYLARAGMRAVLLEARAMLGGSAETIAIAEGFCGPALDHVSFALDPRVVKELGLQRHGLAFAETDIRTMALRQAGEPILLPGAGLFRHGDIAAVSSADADAYIRFWRETRRLARRVKPLWTAEIEPLELDPPPLSFETAARRLKLSASEFETLDPLLRLSAASYLDRWFESDALKAALSFEAGLAGMSPGETGSALMLLWRLAQESCRLQGGASQFRGGPAVLAEALTRAAQHFGAELRTGAHVASILVEHKRAAGVVLASGEVLRARAVLCSLDRHHTLLNLVPPDGIGFGAAASVPNPSGISEAKLLFALNGLPPFAGLSRDHLRNRLIVAERPESAAEAMGAALTGMLLAELIMDVTVPTVADPSLSPSGGHVVSVMLRYMPARLQGGWEASRELLKKRGVATLEKYAPGFGDRVVASLVLTPEDLVRRYGGNSGGSARPLTRLLSGYAERIKTPLKGLFLCGRDAEPVDAVSCRAARLASAHAYFLLHFAGAQAS